MSIKFRLEKDKAVRLINNAKKIMVLSGAGLSTEAGIPDFRSKNGLYSQNFHGYAPETVLSNSFYNNNPDLFWEYLRTKMNYSGILPDDSYRLLAKMEEKGKIFCTVTQNIDSLHLEAGSKNVIEVHGTLKRCFCPDCGRTYDAERILNGADPYICECKGTIRPDVVLYDEDVPKIMEAFTNADKCDLLLVLGTSLVVYPVAYIPRILIDKNVPVIIINKTPTPYSKAGNVVEINDSIGSTLKYIFKDQITEE